MKDFEKEFLEFLSGTFQRFGLDPLSSQMAGILFIEPEEIAMEDLAKRTGYSLASISTKIRPLEERGMVKKVKKPGTKRSFYFMDKDFYGMMMRKLDALERVYINPAKNTLPNILKMGKTGKLTTEEKKKIDIIQRYHRQLAEATAIFDKFREELNRKGT